MNNLFRKYFVLVMALVAGLLWLEANAAKPEKITVTEAIPDEGLRGEPLTVRIKGTGFGPGSGVRFLVTGTNDDSQIDVGAVVYDGATGDLVADIEVLYQALVDDYDVEVRTSSGRRGKGTTLFAVLPVCDDPARWHPSCNTGGEGTFTPIDVHAGYTDVNAWEEADPYPTLTPGWENWIENTLTAVPRPCTGYQANQIPTSGRYHCEDENALGGRISIDLAAAGATWVDVTPGNRQPYPGFCMLLNRWADFSPGTPLSWGVTWYQFLFASGCTPGQCPIQITTMTYSGEPSYGYIELHPFRNLNDLGDLSMVDAEGNLITELPDVGPLTVFGYVYDSGAVDYGLAEGELNVFTVPQVLPVAQLRIRFGKNSGPSKPIAICETTALQDVWFETAPQLP